MPAQEEEEQRWVVTPTKPQGIDPPASRSMAEAINNHEETEESKPQDASGEMVDGDDPLLDLDQLEELHDEAERMKALGNKHMAAQVRIGILMRRHS